MPKVRQPRKPQPRFEIGADAAKRTLGELISRVGFGKERIIITRNGKKVAALVSFDDLTALDAVA